MPIGDDIRALGWRQGVFFDGRDVDRLSALIGLRLFDGALAIVVTHTCDLVYPRLDNEPFAELIIGRILDGNPDPGFENCRSTRKLHLPVQFSDGRVGYIELKQADIYRVSRDVLAELQPSQEISINDDARIKLTRWLALRYSRAALPDAFEYRSRDIKREIRIALRPVSSDVNSIYLGLSDFNELDEAVNYQVVLYFVMEADIYNDRTRRQAVEMAMDRVRTLLENCQGIEVLEFDVRSTDDVTLEDVKGLVLWNMDHVSLAEDPAAPLPISPTG